MRHRIVARVGAVSGLELVRDVLADAIVPVLAPQPNVAFDGQRLEMVPAQADQRHVEGAAAEVVDQHGLLRDRQWVAGVQLGGIPRLEGVRQRRRRRLVEDVEHLEPGDAAGVLGRLAPRVVEVGRHGDDGPADLADAVRGILDQLAQDQRRQRFGAEVAAGDGLGVLRMTHPALDEQGDAIRMFEGHVAGRLADDRPAVLDEHGTGREHFAVQIGKRDRLAAVVERGDGGEGGAEIDADNRVHINLAGSVFV